MRIKQSNHHPNLSTVIGQILYSARLNQQDHGQLNSGILSNNEISYEPHSQMRLISDYIQTGQLGLVNLSG